MATLIAVGTDVNVTVTETLLVVRPGATGVAPFAGVGVP
jgi:hypothetical protein